VRTRDTAKLVRNLSGGDCDSRASKRKNPSADASAARPVHEYLREPELFSGRFVTPIPFAGLDKAFPPLSDRWAGGSAVVMVSVTWLQKRFEFIEFLGYCSQRQTPRHREVNFLWLNFIITQLLSVLRWFSLFS
jgi:hypothetical protein